MKRLFITLAILLISGRMEIRADDKASATGAEDLFSADLTNAAFPAGLWSWEDSVLSPKDKDEVIWTKKEYENFILDLDFDLEPGANSGVLIYSSDTNNWIPNTLEIQVLDDPDPKWAKIPPNWKCGGIFGHSVPLKSPTRKAGEWNHMTITAHGPSIRVVINGELVTDINMQNWKSGNKGPDGTDIVSFEPHPLAEMATKGHIGLQGAHGGIPTHFRNLKIRSID
jgi:Domain of Unknown Function (DUF1080)